MAENLKEFLENLPCEPGYTSEPWHNRAGDCLEYHFLPGEYYAERVDDVLTVYRSMNDDRIVGFQVKGMSAVTQRLGQS